jgi:hypothetical protein
MEARQAVQSVQCLTIGWTVGAISPTEAEDFSSNLFVQTGSGAHPASCTYGSGVSFPAGKTLSECGADHSPPSSTKLYLLSIQAPPWRVAEPLYPY